jgi:hypothetical protein
MNGAPFAVYEYIIREVRHIALFTEYSAGAAVIAVINKGQVFHA